MTDTQDEAREWLMENSDSDDPLIQRAAQVVRALLADQEWQLIETLLNNDDFILAATRDGRRMIWKASILLRNIAGPTPKHLQFPATHWRSLPAPPSGDNA